MTDPEPILTALCDLVQEDVGCRGLRADPVDNLINATAGDFAAACHSIADTPKARLAVVTGFTIPGTDPPAAETDGPLGALFLARALTPLGIGVALAADGTAVPALAAGLAACGLTSQVPLVELPDAGGAYDGTIRERSQSVQPDYLMRFSGEVGSFTHLLALERVGPTHTRESIGFAGRSEAWDEFPREVPEAMRGRCLSMRGRDVTALTIVAGVSNWGAYALATGVRLLRGAAAEADLYDVNRERELLRLMVDAGPLVDGVTGERTLTVDGLTFERYGRVLRRLGELAVGDAS